MKMEQEASEFPYHAASSSAASTMCSTGDSGPDTREKQNLHAVKQQVETEEADLLIEGTISLQVDVSIERAHYYQPDEATGEPRLVLGKGWFVSLSLPSRVSVSADAPLFRDGETQMQCDLGYAGEEGGTIAWEDAIRALGIDVEAKIWTITPAP